MKNLTLVDYFVIMLEGDLYNQWNAIACLLTLVRACASSDGYGKCRATSYDRKSIPMEATGKGRDFHVAALSCIVDERIARRGVARYYRSLLRSIYIILLLSIGPRTTFFSNFRRIRKFPISLIDWQRLFDVD